MLSGIKQSRSSTVFRHGIVVIDNSSEFMSPKPRPLWVTSKHKKEDCVNWYVKHGTGDN